MGCGLAESAAVVYKRSPDTNRDTIMPAPVTHSDQSSAPSLSAARPAALRPALVAFALGLALLYVVGFAGPQVIHDAAHDARHSLNFPCH
jgi:cobalt transporter subunit CbtB